MSTDNVLFLMPLITGPVFFIAGFLLRRYPPRHINWLLGYRTHRAMRSQAHWDFAQRYAGRELMIWGAVYMATSLLGAFFFPHEGAGVLISILLLLIFSIIPIVRTESRLKQEFDEI
jgi:uncharacterized membrane protein